MRVCDSPGREGDDPEPQGRGSSPARVVRPDPAAPRALAHAASASGPEDDSGAPRGGDELDRSPPDTVVSPSAPISVPNSIDVYVNGAIALDDTASEKTTLTSEQSVAAVSPSAPTSVSKDADVYTGMYAAALAANTVPQKPIPSPQQGMAPQGVYAATSSPPGLRLDSAGYG